MSRFCAFTAKKDEFGYVDVTKLIFSREKFVFLLLIPRLASFRVKFVLCYKWELTAEKVFCQMQHGKQKAIL